MMVCFDPLFKCDRCNGAGYLVILKDNPEAYKPNARDGEKPVPDDLVAETRTVQCGICKGTGRA